MYQTKEYRFYFPIQLTFSVALSKDFPQTFLCHQICPKVLLKGILTPSFIEIAPAVTKRALLTDDDDGCHVIAIAIAIAKNRHSIMYLH
jgi:hypothetical protein